MSAIAASNCGESGWMRSECNLPPAPHAVLAVAAQSGWAGLRVGAAGIAAFICGGARCNEVLESLSTFREPMLPLGGRAWVAAGSGRRTAGMSGMMQVASFEAASRRHREVTETTETSRSPGARAASQQHAAPRVRGTAARQGLPQCPAAAASSACRVGGGPPAHQAPAGGRGHVTARRPAAASGTWRAGPGRFPGSRLRLAVQQACGSI